MVPPFRQTFTSRRGIRLAYSSPGTSTGGLLSPTLFNIFLERIMSDALEEHDGKVSIGGRNITNLRFADDIDALAEEEQSLIITLPKKGNLQLCQNYRTISLISHSSKVMLKVILNRLKPQAEEIIAEEQAGFRAGRSTTEQIFNLRILCEKYLQHQQNLYHVFIDFKKAFDRVWHAALWATMRKYNISANLVRTIEQLYDKATSAVQMNGSIGEWFRTTVGVRQG